MSASPRGLSSGQNPSWTLAFWNRVHRYRCLVQKFWWVLVLTLSACLFAAAWYQISRPLSYMSTASLTVDTEHVQVKLGGDQGGNSGLTPDDTMAYEMPVIKGRQVQGMAVDALQVKYPDMLASPVKLTVLRDNAILTLIATGPNAQYTERYLQAVVNAYFENRRIQRTQATDSSFKALNDDIASTKVTLKEDDDAINNYQQETGVVFGKEDANGANVALAAARQKLDTYNDQHNNLLLMTPEQGLKGSAATRRGTASAQPSPANVSSVAESQYQQASATLVQLNADYDELKVDLRDKHPRMQKLLAQIDSQKKLLASLVRAGSDQIDAQRKLLESQIAATQKEFDAAQQEVIRINKLRVKFDQLQDKKKLDLDHYTEAHNTLSKSMTNRTIAADPIRKVDPVSIAEPVPASWAKTLGLAFAAGLALGVGVLALIDRLDDRMGSINDFQLHFAEQVLGQIPRDPIGVDQDTDLLKPDDARHQLVESFRNLRSTLLYMPMEGERPKTLLVTSAVPNEGKSTVSSNLALVLAAAGMKTLLIDADLRRGAIHDKFDITRDPGLTDVLGHNVNWKIAIRQTKVENLHVMPRGRNVPQPSEYLLNKNTDRLLQELYPLYDFIIIDSSPVLAADDTSSLAPKIDATLFVVRMGFTSAKMTGKSLEILYGRQANIPGVILNQVDTSSPEFVYYQYSEYYHVATDEDDKGGASGQGKAGVKPTQPTVEV